MPCRVCQIRRSDILKFNAQAIVPRDDNASGELLPFAFPAYCKKLKSLPLTANEQALLQWCKDNSLNPLRPSFFSLRKPYDDFNVYSMAPFDYMHTLGGVMENWVSTTAVCTAECGKHPEFKRAYSGNIGTLDLKISHMPLKHGLPLTMTHFKEGVSGIVGLGSTENSNRTGGSGALGMIDCQDVPQLVLQMILGKSPFF